VGPLTTNYIYADAFNVWVALLRNRLLLHIQPSKRSVEMA